MELRTNECKGLVGKHPEDKDIHDTVRLWMELI
jgi:hypothetical protein